MSPSQCDANKNVERLSDTAHPTACIFSTLTTVFVAAFLDFRQQTDPLSPEDMLAVWNTLKAVRNTQDALAFYNCGSRSGASQPHKHMQVIPLEEPAPIAALVRECSKRQPGKKENRPGNRHIPHVLSQQDVNRNHCKHFECSHHTCFPTTRI